MAVLGRLPVRHDLRGACIPPHLIAYHTLIEGYAITYGARCWPLLYQQDVRFRHEEMPEILYRETKKLEASILNNTHVKGVGLDMDRPWNHCWSLLLTTEVKEWWADNFKDHTTLILTGVKRCGAVPGRGCQHH